MISSVTFHPFLSHFPSALLVAGLCLLWLARNQNHPRFSAAASFNLSIGFLMSVLATLSGMVSADVNLRTNIEVQEHQGYSLLWVVLYGFCAGYSYTRAWSKTALTIYGLNLVAMGASVITGYWLVFS